MKKRLVRSLVLLVFFFGFLSGCKKDNIFRDITPHDFLSADKYERLIVEIQYVQGYAPTEAALNELRTFLSQRLNKPSGIAFLQTQISSPGKAYYGQADVEEIEKKNRKEFASKNTVVLYVLFLDGEYAGNSSNSKVLGIAYSETSLCIFEKSIQEHSGATLQPPTHILETLVAEHEFGHIFGLVNHGSGMQTNHQDSSNGHHCDNKNCLMFFLAETSDVVANLTGGAVPELDANCLNDLRSNGGR